MRHSTDERKVKAQCTNTVVMHLYIQYVCVCVNACLCYGGRARWQCPGVERELQIHFMLLTSVITPQIASWSHFSEYLVSKNEKITFVMIPIIIWLLCWHANTVTKYRQRRRPAILACLQRWCRVVCGEIEEHLGHGSSTPDGDGGGEDGSAVTARHHGHQWVELQPRHKIHPLLGFSR